MPRTNKQEAPVTIDAEVLTSRQVEIDDYTVVFEEYHLDADAAPAFRGLPDDSCQCPHWGIVVAGELRYRYPDGVEVFHAGDAYLARPGHVPIVKAGTEIIEFSPTAELQETLQVVGANMANGAADEAVRLAKQGAR